MTNDVDAKLRALERQLENSENRFRSIILRNADGILVIDTEGRVRFCNPAAEALFGQPAHALIGSIFGFPLVAGETTEVDILVRGSDSVIAEMRAVEIEWEGDRAFLASMRDLTDRKRAEEALRLRNRAIEASTSGILIIDARQSNLPITYVNAAFEQITGYRADDVIGQPSDYFLCDVGTNNGDYQRLREALREGREAVVTMQNCRADGTLYWNELRVSPLRSAEGELMHFVGVQNDITGRKELEAERIEREKLAVALDKERELRGLKDRFLTMMSHELRTPLALIQLSYDMLRQYSKMATEEERQQYLDNIQVQVDHLTEMINDVMTISRSDSGDHDFDPELLDLITYCRSFVEEFQLNYYKTHTIEFECDELVIRAPIDRKLMRQALTNLLSNAIKYSPKGSVITMRLHTEQGSAVIDIIDHGIGIPTEDQPHLFEAFHRGNNVDAIPGTGLGLAIVKQSVKVHSGTISVRSRIGEGSTFTVRLPLTVRPSLNSVASSSE